MFTRRLAAAIGLLFALVGMQGPEFTQQYRQRLGGALDELKRVVSAFDADAARQSITPVEAIARLALLVGALALVIGWGGTHICAWPIRRRWREWAERRRATASSHWT